MLISAGAGHMQAIVFFIAMLAGMAVHELSVQRLPKAVAQKKGVVMDSPPGDQHRRFLGLYRRHTSSYRTGENLLPVFFAGNRQLPARRSPRSPVTLRSGDAFVARSISHE